MIIKNCGSFFANPLISQMKLASLSDSLGVAIPHWPNEDGQIKISAAWLIEHAGLAQLHDQASGMAIWEKQPLVFVNEHASQTAQLLQFKQLVVDCVAKTFGITLIQEPELLPFAS
jgi:UDP-N-acetylmuramate dehydrogenase